MPVKSCELALIALSNSALLRMSPALARSSEDTVFSRFAYRAARVSIEGNMNLVWILIAMPLVGLIYFVYVIRLRNWTNGEKAS
jgi:hypothetical protein